MFARFYYTCVLEVYEHIVAKHKSVRFDVQVVGDGFTWRRASSSLEIDEETLEDHRETITSGARTLREDAFVKAHALLFSIVSTWCFAFVICCMMLALELSGLSAHVI